VLIGVTGVVIGIAIGHCIGDCLTHPVASLTSASVAAAAPHVAMNVHNIDQVVTHLTTAAHGAVHGAENTFVAEAHHGVNAATPYIVPGGHSTAFATGQQLGNDGVIAAQKLAGSKIAQTIFEQGVHKSESPNRK